MLERIRFQGNWSKIRMACSIGRASGHGKFLVLALQLVKRPLLMDLNDGREALEEQKQREDREHEQARTIY